MNNPRTLPNEHPIKIPGKKRPAGTAVPYVIIVNKYQMIKKRRVKAHREAHKK